MPKTESTRLRFISSNKREDISMFISRLPFKIEIKSIVQDKNKSIVWFVIPDEIKDFKNIDLDKWRRK